MDPKITEIIPTEMKTSKDNLHIATYSESGNTGNKMIISTKETNQMIQIEIIIIQTVKRQATTNDKHGVLRK